MSEPREHDEQERERIIFHVDMNAFFASVEQQCQPHLRGKPIVVCGNPEKRTVVAACSYEAKAFGVKNGMSVFEAKQLCPMVILVEGDPSKYVDVAQHIFGIMEAMTPEMEIFSIDEAFLDMTETWPAAGESPEAAARQIKASIRAAYGLTCSVGIGPNKLIAKVAAGSKKPDGLVRVREAEVPAFLEPMPIEKLCGVGPNLQRTLNELGIVTCGDLGRAPEPLLVRKYGVVGRYLKRMGQGIDHSPVLSYTMEAPVKSMGHAYTLPRDTPDEDEVWGTLLRLSEQVARRLRADAYQGRTIGLTIRYGDFTGLTHHDTIAYPTDHGPRIARAAWELFGRYCQPLRHRVRLVGVGVSNLVRNERQLSFLDEEIRNERLDVCVDRLDERFGDFTLVRAAALEPLVPKSHGFLLKQRRRELTLK